ncbi:SWIM zinc finger family protein [Streptomyces sp. NPDC004647]|uniref:SWIM zinc finger family protein n=1 Tax=Streptomyces sp. NPDC004647 TaxID=3154671 RepID=UPI0033AB309F
MTQQGVRWTVEQVLALAPDAASRKAGSRLGVAGPWSATGANGEAVWGLCKGSGSKPYQTVVAVHDAQAAAGPGYKCSCPSRKFPCKHALGLLLLWAEGASTVPYGQDPPEWAGQWLEGRRQRTGQKVADAAPASGGRSADPAAARRRAELRAEGIAAGAAELEQRLIDLLHGGLAAADGAGYAAWDETAARMVDAKAAGLAARVRELGTIPSSGAGWPARLLEECALLHLLIRAYLGISGLPEPLAATVHARVGLTTDTADLLAGGQAAVRDRWLVLAQQDSSDGKLTTRRIWLRGEGSGRAALLLSYGAAGAAPPLALPTGLSLDAALTFYPGSRPLRAALGEQFTPPAPGTAPPGSGVEKALAAYGDGLREDPWLDTWPVVLSDVVPLPGPDGWQLADAAGDAALPVDPRCLGRTGLWQLASVSGGGALTVFGTCGHRGFTPLTAWSPDTAEAVSL